MKKLPVVLVIGAAAAGYWTFGMTAVQRADIKAKVFAIPEWSPVSLSG